MGRINSQETRLSIAHMRSPAGWQEPGQALEFEEYTIVLRGVCTCVTGQASLTSQPDKRWSLIPAKWIQYSTPDEATEYIAICLPAFSAGTVHRDETP